MMKEKTSEQSPRRHNLAKETLLTYLEARLKQIITDYEVGIEWTQKAHTIEIFFRLYAENIGNQTIDDAEGTLSEEDAIEFEDGILLYDEKKAKFVADDFLACLPFPGKKGLSKADVNGLVDYLKDVLDEGQSDLLDFLDEDSQAEIFELHFDQEKLAVEVKKYEEKLGTTFVPYPSY
jgi:DNA-3-methyladenine glycosylase